MDQLRASFIADFCLCETPLIRLFSKLNRLQIDSLSLFLKLIKNSYKIAIYKLRQSEQNFKNWSKQLINQMKLSLNNQIKIINLKNYKIHK